MLLKKYEVYSVQEFLNKDVIEEINKIDKMIGHLKRNKNKYRLAVTLIALTVNLSGVNVLALTESAASISVDRAGWQILNLMRSVGYWVCIILCTKDVILKSMKGHMNSVGTVVASYGIAFGTLYFLPWLFDLIQQIF